MDKIKKAALPFIVGFLALFLSLLIIAAILAEMIAIIGSDAGANNKKHIEEEQRQQINLSSLDRFTITGTKVGDKYFLTFLFAGWKIDEIELEDTSELQSIRVKIPAISGTREEMAYSFFVRNGFTPEGACGMLANIDAESGHTWNGAIEEGFLETYQGKDVLEQGYGLCQWTNTTSNYGTSWRRKNVIEHVEGENIDPSNDSDKLFLEELHYAIQEPGYESIVTKMKYSTDANQAAGIWCREWEMPENVDAASSQRGKIAEDYFAALKNRNVNTNDSDSFDEVVLAITIIKKDESVFFDGKLNGIDIGGSFTENENDLTGKGEYGIGATSSGSELYNPFGENSFYVTYVALVWRYCPYHLCNELHGGWDLVCGAVGTPIYSVSDGTCIFSGDYGEYGPNCVVIQTGDTFIFYAHMDSKTVSTGDTVTRGMQVGTQGNEGASAGAHLHLEFRRGSMFGETYANLDALLPVLQGYANNYASIQGDFGKIVR